MRTFSLPRFLRGACLIPLIALGGMLSAQEKLTTTTIGSWQVIGKPVTFGETMVLPASATLARSFATGPVTLRLVSRPFFSPTPAGLPSVGVGPATLTFMRDSSGGAMLLLGDQLLTLPNAIPLAADGRSDAPLEFTLGYDQSLATATLAINGQFFDLPAAAPAGPLEVALIAGDTAPWSIDSLEVLTPPLQTQPDGSTSSAISSDPITPAVPDEPLDPAIAALLLLRQNLADAVIANRLSPEDALAQLRKALLTGELEGDVAFADAAIDLGERLIGAGKGVPAEVFFKEAEAVLELILQHIPDTAAPAKARALRQAADIRGNYLGKVQQAVADLDAAVLLQPEDTYLQTTLTRLELAHPEQFMAVTR